MTNVVPFTSHLTNSTNVRVSYKRGYRNCVCTGSCW